MNNDFWFDWVWFNEKEKDMSHNENIAWAVIENPKPVIFGFVKRFSKAVPSEHFHK